MSSSLLRRGLVIASLAAACSDTPATDAGADTGAALPDAPSDATSDAPGDAPADAGPARVTQIAAGSTGHACARLSTGALRCWGLNDNGQLGAEPSAAGQTCRVMSGGRNVDLPCALRPREVGGVQGVAQVAVGNGTTCARTSDGAVFCWGLNDAGELGQGTGDLRPHGAPARVTLPMPATDLALGAFHACAVVMDGSVYCWGSNKFGQAGLPVATTMTRCDEGDGTLSPCVPSPAAVPGVAGARQVALGRNHTCALLGDGTVRCWGLNRTAQLGSGAVEMDPRGPTMVPGVTDAAQVAAGGSHTCVIGRDGAMRCWGWNALGQLGMAPSAMSCPTPVGSTIPCALAPTAVPGVTGATAMALGRYHSCAVVANGEVRCWGRNDEGQVAPARPGREMCSDPPDVYPCEPAPAAVTIPATSALSAGDYHACAVLADGAARCWGWNAFGQLGDGTTMDRATPVAVDRLP